MTRTIIGFEQHEDLWIKAAIELDCAARMRAFNDIASLTGRTVFQVQDRASRIRAEYRAIPLVQARAA